MAQDENDAIEASRSNELLDRRTSPERRTARQRFQKGDKVKMTQAALDMRLDGQRVRRNTGTVVGFARRYNCITVVLDGTKTRRCFHMDFWEKQAV